MSSQWRPHTSDDAARLGVRYDHLLAIICAQNQRISDHEAHEFAMRSLNEQTRKARALGFDWWLMDYPDETQMGHDEWLRWQRQLNTRDLADTVK